MQRGVQHSCRRWIGGLFLELSPRHVRRKVVVGLVRFAMSCLRGDRRERPVRPRFNEGSAMTRNDNWLASEVDHIPRGTPKLVNYLKEVFWAAVVASVCGGAIDGVLQVATHSADDSLALLFSVCIASAFAYRIYNHNKLTNWSVWVWVLPLNQRPAISG